VRRKAVPLGITLIIAILLLNCISVAGQPQSSAPTIDHPPNVTYLVGTTGHNITWHPSSESPNYYKIEVVNPIPAGPFLEVAGGPPFPVVPRANWTGGPITQNVDGWQVGTYYYTCTVYDTLGNNASSTVTVTVQSAQISIPLIGIELTGTLAITAAGCAIIAGIAVAASVLMKKRQDGKQ
jgi:F0F1-type ATP synthase membrane subunit a